MIIKHYEGMPPTFGQCQGFIEGTHLGQAVALYARRQAFTEASWMLEMSDIEIRLALGRPFTNEELEAVRKVLQWGREALKFRIDGSRVVVECPTK